MLPKYTEDQLQNKIALTYAWGRQDAHDCSNNDAARAFADAWEKYCFEFRTERRFYKTNIKTAYDNFVSNGNIDEHDVRVAV